MYPHRIRLRGPWEFEPLARFGSQAALPPTGRMSLPGRWARGRAAGFRRAGAFPASLRSAGTEVDGHRAASMANFCQAWTGPRTSGSEMANRSDVGRGHEWALRGRGDAAAARAKRAGGGGVGGGQSRWWSLGRGCPGDTLQLARFEGGAWSRLRLVQTGGWVLHATGEVVGRAPSTWTCTSCSTGPQ